MSNMLWTSVLVYLHAVVNGGYLQVYQNSMAVDEVMQ